ncbi:P-loop containing nucleoside triphosphate hydrolase protein [Jimgerdemannia flammicorona]|uniref:RNA helicase n=1 Tax=Jimgerdemannia flammicorona TaxID=994334 RepID=A0A433QS94_9FUNG|nr:P-loop containing nucleoside triphosphate hydrolase protein [Jimgerdemannia flammicorona]
MIITGRVIYNTQDFSQIKITRTPPLHRLWGIVEVNEVGGYSGGAKGKPSQRIIQNSFLLNMPANHIVSFNRRDRDDDAEWCHRRPHKKRKHKRFDEDSTLVKYKVDNTQTNGNGNGNGSVKRSCQKPRQAKKPNQQKEDLLAKREALRPFRRSLPIFSAREHILEQIRSKATVIIVGETGSEIPQYILEAGLASAQHGAIAVTQPRRVAAISLAKRVAEEVGTSLRQKVGYSIRFDDTSSPSTLIKYLTDGMLIRELLSDRLLLKYRVVVLDEAHERTLRTDILFGMVKAIQGQRAEMCRRGEGVHKLKIVVMSATLDAERFSDAKILYVSGRLHPVRIYNTIEPQSDYIDAALVTIFQIHLEQPMGDILVFLTGQEEIETLEKLLKEHAATLPPTASRILACPIFAALPTAQQQRVFTPAPRGTRKVVLATNIAETSITIQGIRYVVDCGVAKVRGFNARIGIDSLSVHPISKSSARQRTGRAGREAAGFCYRLYTAETFNTLEKDTVPEIKRCNLSSAILLLKASGIEDVLGFDYMDRPSRASLERALVQLYALGAIGGDNGKLTDLGRQMAEFPLDPTFSKVLIQSQHHNCTAEVISVISLLSVDSIFYMPQDKREQASEARRKFLHGDGDHLTLLNVLREYDKAKGDREWCRENFLNVRNLEHVLDVQKQLTQFCIRLSISPTTTCGSDLDAVLRCFLAGFFVNTALIQPDGSYRSVVGQQTVNIHPSSTMFKKKVDAIMYNELVFTTKEYVRGVSKIQSAWLTGVAPPYFNNVKIP